MATVRTRGIFNDYRPLTLRTELPFTGCFAHNMVNGSNPYRMGGSTTHGAVRSANDLTETRSVVDKFVVTDPPHLDLRMGRL